MNSLGHGGFLWPNLQLKGRRKGDKKKEFKLFHLGSTSEAEILVVRAEGLFAQSRPSFFVVFFSWWKRDSVIIFSFLLSSPYCLFSILTFTLIISPVGKWNSIYHLHIFCCTDSRVPKIHLFIYSLGNYCGVGAHQRQGKRQEGMKNEKREEKEKDRGTEGETSSPNPGNWCAHRGWRVDVGDDWMVQGSCAGGGLCFFLFCFLLCSSSSMSSSITRVGVGVFTFCAWNFFSLFPHLS